MSDGTCRFDKPIMACPEVHQPAQRVPKPTKNPPKTMKIKPLSVNRFWKLNKSVGNKPEKSLIPKAANSCCVCELITMALGFESNELPITPPKTIPTTKNKFHESFFQSYLKKSIFAGMQAAQTCRSVEERFVEFIFRSRHCFGWIYW